MPKFSKLPEKEDHMDTPIMDELKVEYPDFLPVLFTEILTNPTARRTPIDLAMVFMRDIDKAPDNDCYGYLVEETLTPAKTKRAREIAASLWGGNTHLEDSDTIALHMLVELSLTPGLHSELVNRYRHGLSSFTELTWHDCDITPFTNMGSYRHGQRVAHLGAFTLYLGVSPTGEGLILLHDKNGQVASSNTDSHQTQFTALLGAGWQHDLHIYAQATIKGE